MSKNYKQSIKDAVENPNHISGIFNYCDRWCERCTQTARCSVFELETKLTANKQELADNQNAKFWEYLHGMLSVSVELLAEIAEKHGIDLNTESTEIPKIINDNAELKLKSRKFGLNIINWLQANNEVLFDSQTNSLELTITEENMPIANAVEVIQYYSLFIGAKINRALQVYEGDILENDSDKLGSAKIALIAIERIIAAFMLLYSELPTLEDDILRFLVTLSELRKQIELLFPNAWAFVRPGFND